MSVHRRSLLLVLALVSAACTSGSIPERQDHIVLWNTSEIVVQPTTGDAWTLDTAGRIVSQVTPSPDGRLAWTALDPDRQQPVTHLSDISGDGLVEVTVPTSPFFYAWSPDSGSVGFLGNDLTRGGVMFGIIDVSSASSTQLQTAAPFFVDWGPASDQLFAHVGSTWLGYLDPMGGETSQLNRVGGPFPAPAWTSSGILIVVEEAPSAQADLRSVALQTQGHALVLIQPQSGDMMEIGPVSGAVRFFPDSAGTKVAVIEGDGGEQRLRLLSVPDGNEIDVISGGYFDVVQWSPDGEHLLYSERPELTVPLTPSVWNDGTTTSFEEYLPSVTFARDYIQFWDQYDRSVSLWSASSEAFLLPSSNDDGDSVRLQRLDGTSELHDGFSMGVWTR